MINTSTILRNCMYVFVTSILLYSCTYTSTSTNTNKVATETSALSQKIKTMVDYQDISYQTEKKNTNGVKTSAMVVNIINAKNIPETDDSLKLLGKKIATELKLAAKNSNEYNTYRVVFISKEQNGIITKTMNAGYTFKNGDL